MSHLRSRESDTSYKVEYMKYTDKGKLSHWCTYATYRTYDEARDRAESLVHTSIPGIRVVKELVLREPVVVMKRP